MLHTNQLPLIEDTRLQARDGVGIQVPWDGDLFPSHASVLLKSQTQWKSGHKSLQVEGDLHWLHVLKVVLPCGRSKSCLKD